MIKCFSRYCLAKVGLKSKSRFGCDTRLIAEGVSSWKSICYVTGGIDGRQQRPTKGELRVQAHRFVKILARGDNVGRFEATTPQCISETAQVRIVGLRIVGRLCRNYLSFFTREFRSQLLGDRHRHLTLDRKDVGQFAIKGIGPKMRTVSGFDQ